MIEKDSDTRPLFLSTPLKPWLAFIFLMTIGLGFRVFYFILLRGGNVSMDVLSWNSVIQAMKVGKNPYQETTALNWPPFWMTVLYFVNWVHETWGFRINQIIQVVLLIPETFIMGYLGIRLKNVGQLKHFSWIYSFNFVSVLLIVQHGNFDIFPATMIFLFLRSLVEYLRTADVDHYFFAAFFLGVAIYMKTFPVALCPLLTLHGGSWVGARNFFKYTKRTLLAFFIAILPIAIGMSTLYVLIPGRIHEVVFQYRSLPGFFGFTGVLALLGLDFKMYVRAFPFVLLLFVLMQAWRSQLWCQMFGARGEVKEIKCATEVEVGVYAFATSILIFIQSFGSGFGTQYFMWTFPLLVYLTWILNRIPKGVFTLLLPVTFSGYVFIYGSLETHGAIFRKFQITEIIRPWFHLRLSPGVGQATILLPLFLMYCWILWILWPRKKLL